LNENTLTFYPNPAKEKINIETSIDTKKIQLINITGQLIMEQITIGKKTELCTAGFESGIYFIKVYSHDNVITRKLVIE